MLNYAYLFTINSKTRSGVGSQLHDLVHLPSSIHTFSYLPLYSPFTFSSHVPYSSDHPLILHAETQSSQLLRSKCQNHLSLPCLTIFGTEPIPSHTMSSSLDFLSFKLTLHIHFIIHLSVGHPSHHTPLPLTFRGNLSKTFSKSTNAIHNSLC
jgi:hypothetical protein